MSTSSRPEAWLVAIALAGCLSTLGLDDTERDLDRDRIADAVDNCPDLYNPSQDDRDGTGPGDACDVCPADKAIGRDLDDDQIDDGCDECIGPGDDAADHDNDSIPDGCDPCVDGVSQFDRDDDHDKIPDGCDTCVGFVGVDIDRDMVDDICDACLNGPSDNQDGDAFEDSCDFCPVWSSATNTRTGDDIDRLGDECDPDLSLNHIRRLFDGFRLNNEKLWLNPAEGSWTVIGNALEVVHDTIGKPIIRATQAADVTADFRIRTRVLTVKNLAGISLRTQHSLDGAVDCMIDSAGALSLTTEIPPITMVDPPIIPIGDGVVLELQNVGRLSNSYICTATRQDDPTTVLGTLSALGSISTWTPGLGVSEGATFDWFEVIELTDVVVQPNGALVHGQ